MGWVFLGGGGGVRGGVVRRVGKMGQVGRKCPERYGVYGIGIEIAALG